MPKYTRKEFCDELDISMAYLRVNEKRGKVFIDNDGRIDTGNVVNNDFFSKLKEKKGETVSKPAPQPTQAKRKQVKKEVVATFTAPHESEKEAQVIAKYDLDRQIKELEIEKKQQEIEKTKIQVEKLKGDVIPTDLVNMVFAQHFKSMTNAFYNAADNYIAIIIARLDGKKEDIAFIRGELIEVVNQAVKEGIEESKQNIKNIANEYSEKRGKGESR